MKIAWFYFFFCFQLTFIYALSASKKRLEDGSSISRTLVDKW